MTHRKPPETDTELLDVLTELFNELEVESDEEANQVLRAMGYDPAAVEKDIRRMVDETLATSPLNWRNKKSLIARVKDRVDSARKFYGSRAEMEAAAQELLSLLTKSQLVTAHYRNFEEMTDEDFASWLEELAFLMSENDMDSDNKYGASA